MLKTSYIFLLAGITNFFVYAEDQRTDVSTQLIDESIALLEWQLVGEGEMEVFWFDVYSARLYSKTGKYYPSQYPLKLDISYQRSISSKDLVTATVEQWQHLKIDNQDIKRWQKLINNLWPEVTSGDQLTFVAYSADSGIFYFNHNQLSVINNKKFAESFLGIWLSINTSRPQLRAQLIGD